MFEVVGVVLVLLVTGALIARYILRVLTGAEKRCCACPGCSKCESDNTDAVLERCVCSATAVDKEIRHE